MADLEAVLADVSYLMAMEKSKSTPAARASKKIILPDPRYARERLTLGLCRYTVRLYPHSLTSHLLSIKLTKWLRLRLGVSIVFWLCLHRIVVGLTIAE